MHTRWFRRILIGMSVLAVIAIYRSVVIVDQTESVHVTEFGRPVRLIEQAGLHFKRPFQSARTFDRRLQLDTPPAREMLTRDKKNLEVAWYVSWRIADVDRFLRTVRTVPDAKARLEDMAASVLAAELGVHDLAGLVNVGDRSLLDTMMSSLTRRVEDQAAREYGLEVVAVRLRRLNYPEEVRSAVFEQIRSERQRVAAATRAEGESQARMIKSAADRERAVVIAAAESEAARAIGMGEAQAAKIANEAQSADPAFYQFLKTLETYRAALDARTTLVLSADSSFLRLLTQGVADAAGKNPTSPFSSTTEPMAATAPKERGGPTYHTGAAVTGRDAVGGPGAPGGPKP
jgi:membrane protease subunit HflC